jgi:glycerophosphoryl diester phosphodiesterase
MGMRLRRRAPSRPNGQDWLRQLPVAHRGLHDAEHPENSLAAFEQACLLGYAIELDVLLTSDAIAVVIHDDNAARLTGAFVNVSSSTLAELKKLHLAGTGETVPAMEEVARLVGARTPILVELKTGPPPAVICPAVLAALHQHDVTFAVMSFDPRLLLWFKRHSPATTRVQLSGALRGERLPAIAKLVVRSMLTNVIIRPHAIGYEISSTPSWALSFWRRVLHCPVLFWTVDSPAALDRSRQLRGNVIFENIRP